VYNNFKMLYQYQMYNIAIVVHLKLKFNISIKKVVKSEQSWYHASVHDSQRKKKKGRYKQNIMLLYYSLL